MPHVHVPVQDKYAALEPGVEAEGSREAVAGRVVAKRVMGKLAFLSIRDDRGQIQARGQGRWGGGACVLHMMRGKGRVWAGARGAQL